MNNYRVEVKLELKTSVDVDDVKSKADAIKRAKQFVADAIAIEEYAIDHIKVKVKTTATKLEEGEDGKTKKTKK